MADKKTLKQLHDEHTGKEYKDQWALQNWRSWGSWFSWGSPIGLGLFFVLIAFATWIFFHL